MEGDAAGALISRLRAMGAHLERCGDKLSLKAPAGAVTPALAAEVKAHKEEILRRLEVSGGIPCADRSAPLPLGVVQERMWAHAQIEPDALLYNLPAAWRFVGPFDAGAMVAAFDDFVARHEALRLRIDAVDGLPRQRFAEPHAGALMVEDLSMLPDRAEREGLLARRIEELRVHRFDLGRDPPFAARLFRLGEFDHALFLMPHHLVWDGWCFDLFLRDLRELYVARLERRRADLPALPIQYADYAVWHRRRLAEGEFASDLDFWEGVLRAPPSPPALPADRARPDLFAADGDWVEFQIDSALLDRIRTLASGSRTTAFMAFLTLWRSFLWRITGDADIVIGAPIQARQHADVADVVGCFVNTIFLRSRLDGGKSVEELLTETRETCLAAYERQEAPVEILVGRLGLHRDPSRTPLAQVMFTHQQVAMRPETFGAASIGQIHVNPRMSPTDLMFAVMEGRREARALIHYASGVFSAEQAARIAAAFETFMRRAAANPRAAVASLPLIDDAAFARLTAPWRSAVEGAGKRLPDMIAEAAARHPEKTAVSTGSGAVSYGALMERSSRLARWLAGKGVGVVDIVELMPKRDADMIALALAVWRCGAAYMPLDPAYPAERLRYMVEDSGAKLIVSTSDLPAIADAPALRVNLDEAAPEIDAAGGRVAAPPAARSERAYVIYTSGSTGRPKGVENSHKALANFIGSMMESPGIGSDDRLLAVTTLAFDISILELFAPLAAGADVVIASAEEAADGDALVALVDRFRPTILQATPATWRLLLDSGFGGIPGMTALCGGEALTESLAESLLLRVGALWNMYGPTETTVWSTCRKIERTSAITIGGPIANTTLYVVGAGGALAPDGFPGELWIGGEGVAMGYLNRPEMTAERFLKDPFRPDGGRVYRTGDLARRLPDGEIEHLGRIDAQVKVRGFRIELGEVEAALETHEAVARAVCAVKRDAAGEPMLVGYILHKEGSSVTGSDLRRHLRTSLPNYMLPQAFMEVDFIPLTGSGKVDRNALPNPSSGREPRTERTPPRTEFEAAIAATWRDILKVSDISVGDNFFELGGNSLQAAQMVARLRERTGRRLSLRSVIFESLEQLASGAARNTA